MRAVKRLLPVVCITGITLLMSLLLYGEVMDRAKAQGWQELSGTAQMVKSEIATKFEDEIVKLHLIEEVILKDGIFDVDDIDRLHVDSIQPTTIFSRIDILYPDNTLISNGVKRVIDKDISFEEIKQRGEYLTNRRTDYQTDRECVYYVLPVMENDEILVVLIGMVDAGGLSELFQIPIYDGQMDICIVDSKDGSYIMDSWHDELGNAYEDEPRKRIKGYEQVDLQRAIRNQETGAVAFESRTTGKPLYMYYTPLGMFDWQLAIFIQENILFGYMLSLRKMFWLAGILEAFLLAAYFVWNIGTVRLLEKSNIEIEQQKEQLRHISYRDMLTCMYNRNKYMEVVNLYKGQELKQIGIAYIDLNGLKQVNDLHSHAAGDLYIQNAAKVILNIFAASCYRIGGDEFVILVVGMEKDAFMDKIAALKKDMKEVAVSMSIGFVWEELCCSLGTLIREAEKQMYADKECYYLVHDRRR